MASTALEALGAAAKLASDAGGTSLALVRETHVEDAKARHIWELMQQVEQLEGRQATLKQETHEVSQKRHETDKQLQEEQTRLLTWGTKCRSLEEALVKAQEELQTAQSRVDVLDAESKLRETRFAEQQQEQERHLRERGMELTRGKVENTRDGTEDLLLLRLLHSEVDKWKFTALRLESCVELQRKEEAKNNILLGLLNAQLISGRDESNKLREEAANSRSHMLKLEEEGVRAERRLAELVEAQDHLQETGAQSLREHEYTIARMEAREKRQESLIDSLNTELGDVTQSYDEYQDKSCVWSRTADNTRAVLYAEIAKHKSVEQDLVAHMREQEEIAVTGEGRRQSEIAKLEIALETLAKTSELDRKRLFEESTEMGARAELLGEQVLIEQKHIRELDEIHTVEVAALKDKCAALKETVEMIKRTAEVSERESFETVTKLAASNECMRQRVIAMQNTSAQRDSEHVTERIAVSSDLGAHRKKVQGVEEAMQRSHSKRQTRIEALTEERNRALCGGMKEEDVQNEVHRIREEVQGVLYERDMGLKRLESLEQQDKQKDRYIKDRFVAFEAEAKALQSEIKSLVGEVTKLEVQVAETHEFRTKAAENTTLEGEIKHCKVEIRHMQNVISTMTVEKGLLDGYKTKVLTEQNSAQLTKLKQLERSKSSCMPLLQELVSTAKKHGVAEDVVSMAEPLLMELAAAAAR